MFGRKRKVDDFSEEIDAHLQLEFERQRGLGLSDREARSAARRAFGNVMQAKERFYESGRWHWWDHFRQDVRYSARMLCKSPGFAVIAILTLAVGIGANTAIFTILNCVLLRALPISHPEQLVTLTDPDSHGGYFGSQTGERSLLAYTEFEYLRDHNDVFDGLLAVDSELPIAEMTVNDSTLGAGSENETARVSMVSGDYFCVLGISPAAGRFFNSDVGRALGAAPVAVISYNLWQQRFHLHPDVIGKTLKINRQPFQIVGVAPQGFFGETVGQVPDVWVPLTMQRAVYPHRDYLSASAQGVLNQHMWLQVFGRLKAGVSLAQASASINVLFQRMLHSTAGDNAAVQRNFLDQRLTLQPGARGASTLHEAFAGPLRFLMILVGLVLLIACANVANLLVARGAARQKEIAVRIALGSGRMRLVRQLLTESLLLATLGALGGVALANWADHLLLRMVSGVATPVAVQLNLHPDVRVLCFTIGVTVLTALLFGLIPSWYLSRVNLSPVLKSAPLVLSSASRQRRLSIGKVLVVVQVAVSLILLVAAGLFVRSVSRLRESNLGYDRENLLLFTVNVGAAGFKGPGTTRLYEDVLERIGAVPGVRGVTVSHNGLFSDTESGDPISVEGYVPKPGEEMDSSMDHVGPRYFSTLGIPILLGREIEAQDSLVMPRAAVINETFARRFFPGTNPLGKRVRDTYPANPADMVVVGMVADAKYRSLREKTGPRIYAPLFNPMWEQGAAIYEVRTFADPSSVSTSLRQIVRDTSESLPPIEIHTLSGLVDKSLRTDRFIELLSSAFGMLAILLAGIGLYGVMAYTVARRTREMGIRLALGAAPRKVLWHVLEETLLLVSLGIIVGVPIALAGTRLVRSLLFGLGFADPVALVSAVILLAAVALLAGLLPARRASLVDPMVALRYE
jgi:predicted permease